MDSITEYIHFPITAPTLVFTIVLGIIFLAPLIFPKLRIPHIIGMIVTGMLIGENGFNVIERNEGCELFSQIGIYYIMFLAGLEMELADLKHSRKHGLVFGLLTALIPFAFGYVAGSFFLGYSQTASFLLACIMASHTLVAYPIVGRYGLTRHHSVQVAVFGTVFALLFALIVLATVAGTFTGDGGLVFWLWFLLKFTLFLLTLFFILPKIIRFIFKKVSDSAILYVFVLAMMFLSAVVADLCGLEGILGAFLCGLVFNRFIPHSGPLMNRVEFVGNAIFIPFFLLGVGMIVNVKPLFTSSSALVVVGVLVVVGTLSKYLAAFFSRKMFSMSSASGLMLFGLSEAHAAGALAMVMVGRSLHYSDGLPLMNNDVLDGVVVMILLSCIISSICTEQAAKKLKLSSEEESDKATLPWLDDEKILVLLKNQNNIQGLVETANMMRNPELNRGLICLNVVNDASESEKWLQESKNLLSKAEEICVASNVKVQSQSRLASNLINGVVHAFRENDASEAIIGMHSKSGSDHTLIGSFANHLIHQIDHQVTIVKYVMNTYSLRRIVVAIPENAEYESGFRRWVERLARLTSEIGCRIVFNGSEQACNRIMHYMRQYHRNVRSEYHIFSMSDGLGQLKDSVNPDHLLVIVSARAGTVSYQGHVNKQMGVLNKYFPDTSVMIIYPDQRGQSNETTFTDPHRAERIESSKIGNWLSKWVSKIG